MAREITINKPDTNLSVKTTTKADRSLLIKDLLESYQGDIARALPSVITPERFTRIALTAIINNDKLLASTQASIVGALFVAAQLGLEPNTPLGQAYIIPYKNNKTGALEATFQIGYKGILDLAHRSGELKSVQAHTVHEKDHFEYELGLDPKLKHIPADGDRGKIKYVYAVYHLKSGGYGFEVMSVADIERHRKTFSKAANSDAWVKTWDAMAKKTVILKALKYAPMKSDFIQAAVLDEQRYIVKENNLGGERLINVEPDIEAQFEVIQEEPKKKGKKEEPVEEEDIMADAPSFLKDTE